jgi:hypothetical protein
VLLAQENGPCQTFLLGSLESFLLKRRQRSAALKRRGANQSVTPTSANKTSTNPATTQQGIKNEDIDGVNFA